jgi:putative transposase
VPYWRLFYHLVWSTYRREPIIDEPTADLLQRSLRMTCHDLQIITHAIGTMPDHIHLAVSIPPTIAVTDAIGRLKGSASHFVNRSTARAGRFSWQTEYAVLSFGERNLADVVDYVQNQPARHAENRLWRPLEPTKDSSKGPG